MLQKSLSLHPGSFVAIVCVLLFGLTPQLPAQNSELAQPASVFDSATFDEFDATIEKEIKAGRIAGCSALLIRDDQVVFDKVWGHRDRERELAVEKDTIWRIYSMSKPITSVAVMQLVEQGKISLDEPASTYLPEFKNLKVLGDNGEVECRREMTVRDLLRHTSGLTYGFFGNTAVDQQYRRSGVLVTDNNLAETITKLSKIPLLNQPGSKWHYSVSTDVLGRIVEVASGQSFKEYLSERIFKPLGMLDTFFTVPKNKQSRFAQMYAPTENGQLTPARKASSIRFLNENQLYSGGGGLCSTSHDYLQFCKMLLNNGTLGSHQILKPESIKKMFTNQIPKKAGAKGFKFGLGFRITPQRHYNWGGAAGTRFWVDPKNKIAGVFMIQINPYQAKHYGNNFKFISYRAFRKSK